MEGLYSRVLRFATSSPWAIVPAKLEAIRELLELRAAGERLSREEISARIGAGPARRRSSRAGAIAVIPIYGTITPRADLFSEISGGTSVQGLQRALREALADDSVGSILFDVDSPGGNVDLIAELAGEIRAARGRKPMAAVANTMAASAAYWLASQADELTVTPSGEVGSIGVLAMHRDVSAFEAKIGHKTTVISAGEFKAEAHPFEPLTDEAREEIQAAVDYFHGLFLADVAAGRGVDVEHAAEHFGRGRMVNAEEAVRRGMADRVATIEETARRLAGGEVLARAHGALELELEPAALLELAGIGAIAPATIAAGVTTPAPAAIATLTTPTHGGTPMAPEPITTPAPPVAGHITPADAPALPAAATTEPLEVPVILTPHAGGSRRPELVCSGGALVQAMIAAERGDQDARRLVEAALVNVLSTDVPGLMPPAYTTDVLGELPTRRPLAENVCVRRPMTATGMEINKPKWGTKPNGGWRANVPGAGEDDPIASNTPTMTTQAVSVREWAWGVALSYAVATRSSPDAIEAIYRAAVADYYNDVEAEIAALLLANDQAGAAGAGLGAGVAAFFGDENAGPELLVVAPDIYGDLIEAEGFLMYSSGSVSGAGLTGNIAGLDVVVSGHLPAGTEIITARGVIELRETDPVRLTANAIGALMVELGVTAFTTIDLERPNAIHSLTPAAGAPAGSTAARSKAARAKGDKGSK